MKKSLIAVIAVAALSVVSFSQASEPLSEPDSIAKNNLELLSPSAFETNHIKVTKHCFKEYVCMGKTCQLFTFCNR